ncbi:MAG: hypothetical protein LH631_08560 [Alkalinema sp. CAN_BIN05]|nr:hypothetical protein [Alkalinema sp. CAN_BIN05]
MPHSFLVTEPELECNLIAKFWSVRNSMCHNHHRSSRTEFGKLRSLQVC